MKSFRSKTAFAGVLYLILIPLYGLMAGCGGSDPAALTSDLTDTDLQQLDSDNFDGVTPLRAGTHGLQIAVSPVVTPQILGAQVRWVLSFEANRPLLSALPFGAEGELGRGQIHDQYRFDVTLERPEVKYLLAGGPLYLRLRTATGERRDYAGLVRLGSRFMNTSGSMLIWVHPEVERVSQGEDALMRGYATVASRIQTLNVFSDAGGDPETIAFNGESLWSFDWRPNALLQASDVAENPVHLVGRDQNGDTHQLQARLVVVTSELGVTTGDALDTWPAKR